MMREASMRPEQICSGNARPRRASTVADYIAHMRALGKGSRITSDVCAMFYLFHPYLQFFKELTVCERSPRFFHHKSARTAGAKKIRRSAACARWARKSCR